MYETLGDLAQTGKLVGRRVRFLGTDVPALVPFGTIGVVQDVRPHEPKALVVYKRTDVGAQSVWHEVHLESHFRFLELVTERMPYTKPVLRRITPPETLKEVITP